MKIISDQKISPEALDLVRERTHAGQKWYAYQNVAFDSAGLSDLQFLRVGTDCTFAEPPQKYPFDSQFGMGWRFWLVGEVNLVTGEIEELKQ